MVSITRKLRGARGRRMAVDLCDGRSALGRAVVKAIVLPILLCEGFCATDLGPGSLVVFEPTHEMAINTCW